jgi:2-alkenal reductase
VRTAPLATVAVACALLGGVAALALGKLTGWTDGGSTTTVVREAALEPAQNAPAPAAVRSTAKPLPGNDFDPRAIYVHRSAGVVTIVANYGSTPSQGSGFVVSPQGYILTNSHVITTAGNGDSVEPADSVFVEFQDHDRVEATIVGWDVFDDVGLIRLAPSAHRLAPVPLGNSKAVTVGEPVAAIGSPFGNENSLTVGVVSATHRSVDSLTSTFDLVDAIQTDAPITHGNSGGPLFDARGRVIGINAQIDSESGNGEGVGFAVPINSAKRSMRQLIVNGSVSYAFVGIETSDLTPTLAKRFGYSVSRGAVVTDVVDGSPAEDAGLRSGSGTKRALGVELPPHADVIVGIDGHAVRSSEDIVRIVTGSLKPGETVSFTIQRGDTRRDVSVHLGERSESTH